MAVIHRVHQPFGAGVPFISGASPRGAVLRPVIHRTRDSDFIVAAPPPASSSSTSSAPPSPKHEPVHSSMLCHLPEPSAAIVTLLRQFCPRRLNDLRQQLRQVAQAVQNGVGQGTSRADTCRSANFQLTEVHTTLVALDEETMEDSTYSLATSEEHAQSWVECRRWVGQLQSFLMQLQRDLDRAARSRRSSSDDPSNSCGADADDSSVDRMDREDCPLLDAVRLQQQLEAQGGADGVGSEAVRAALEEAAAREAQWLGFAHALTSRLQRMASCLDGGEEEGVQHESCHPLQQQQQQRRRPASGARLVCPRSRLPYKSHWAGKVVL